MENRREEIKGLKRLLVGVLVAALLITMLPFENMGTFVARAEDVVTENMPESLSEHELFLNAAQVMVNNVEELQQILSENDFAKTYSNGVIIKYEGEQDLNFSGADLIIPAGLVGIELGGYSIMNVGSISFDLTTTSTSTEYGYNFFVLGDNTNSTITFIKGEGKTIWQVEPNQQVVLYGVDVVNADIIAYTSDVNSNGEECGEYGVVLGYDGLYLELPAYYETGEQQYAIYREDKGIFRYNKEKDILYIDRLYEGIIVGENALLDVGSFDLCLLNIVTGEMSRNEMNWANKQVYSKSAMEQLASITGDALLCYYGDTLIQNPKIELYTEWDGHGVYTVTDEKDADGDKHVMTIYDYRGDEYSYGTEESTDDEITVYLDISENFFEGQSSQVEDVYDQVVFRDGAIPKTYYAWITDSEYEEYPITNIRVADNMWRQAPEFVFDFTSNTEALSIYNYSDSNIVVQDDTEQNEIWTDWNVYENTENGDYLLNVENAEISTIETTEYNENQFAKVGSTFTVTPDDSYVLYNIHLGNCYRWTSDDGAEYEYMSRSNLVTSDYVKINTDGTLEVTIPGQKSAFYASTTQMQTISLFDEESNMYAELGGEPVTITTENDTQVAWHSGEFSVIGYADTEFTELEDGSTYIKHIYEICDIATKSDEGWLSAIEIKDECINKEQVYYVIDRSMQKDYEDGEEYPASSYGQITKLTYTYSMDLASPQINGVTATDGDGNKIELEGDWVSTDETPPDIAMVWLKGPVTFVVDSDETEGVEYRYNYGAWQSSNTIITDEEREGNWFEVRDAFDIATGRDEGSWYTNVGIDNTAPTIYYTDANYAPDGSEIADLLDSGDEGYKDYEGNLYLETNDYSASGVNTLTLYCTHKCRHV